MNRLTRLEREHEPVAGGDRIAAAQGLERAGLEVVRLARRADAAAIAALSRDEIEHGLPWRWRALPSTATARRPPTG